MKTQLIILPDYNIIVSNEKIKTSDLSYHKKFNTFYIAELEFDDNIKHSEHYLENYFKVIASDNPEHNLPSIDYNGLEERFGIVDVEKLAKESELTNTWDKEVGFIEGFKKAQELNTKKFTLDDMKKALSMKTTYREDDCTYFNKSDEQIMTSLQQPKVFDIEIEDEYPFPYVTVRPKITDNKIKII